MIVLIGYHYLGLTVDQVRALLALPTAQQIELRPSIEKNNWDAKVEIPGRNLAMKGASGFLTNKYGHWYIVDWRMKGGKISFTAIKSDSSESHIFSLKLAKDGQHWGQMQTVGQSPKTEWAINCAVFRDATLSVPIGLPEEMFERPSLLN